MVIKYWIITYFVKSDKTYVVVKNQAVYQEWGELVRRGQGRITPINERKFLKNLGNFPDSPLTLAV
jgi:hypothetical protein